MCYNIKVQATQEQIVQEFKLAVLEDAIWGAPRRHLTIGQNIPAVVLGETGNALDLFYWGFTPGWEKDPKGGMRPGNARRETIDTTPMFRGAFKLRRCIVPATGFYEWIGEKGNKQLLPFHVAGREIFGIPGVWDEWTAPDGSTRRSCAIVTCDPSADIRPYHDRMPVILERGDYSRYLSPDTCVKDAAQLLAPLPEGSILPDMAGAFKPARH